MSSGAGSPCLQVTVEDLKCTVENCPWAESNFNALVRVEVRGDGKPVKAVTSLKSVHGLVIAWHETLELPLSSDASELRLMLCKEKSAIPGKKGNPVMAACGIYIKDIMDAVPIDKYFQVFKPSTGSAGGDIRVRLNLANSRSALADPGDSTIPEEDDDADSDKPRRLGGLLRKLLLLAALGAAGVVAYKRQQI